MTTLSFPERSKSRIFPVVRSQELSRSRYKHGHDSAGSWQSPRPCMKLQAIPADCCGAAVVIAAKPSAEVRQVATISRCLARGP